MRLSEEDKRLSHRAACYRYYTKNKPALRESAKMRMRQLRARRKLEEETRKQAEKAAGKMSTTTCTSTGISSSQMLVQPNQNEIRAMSARAQKASSNEHRTPRRDQTGFRLKGEGGSHKPSPPALYEGGLTFAQLRAQQRARECGFPWENTADDVSDADTIPIATDSEEDEW